MVIIKRSLWIILGLFIAVVIAACGSNSSTSTGAGANQASPTAANTGSTPTTSGSNCGRYCSSSTPTASASGSAASIKTAMVTFKGGKRVTALTNGQGMTLYYRTSDTPTQVCDSSGGCATAWPPLLSSTVPTSSGSLPGKLSVLTDTNGSQVEYNGHPLYMYSGDSAPGQTNGEGLFNVWFTATTDLAPANGSQSGSNGY